MPIKSRLQGVALKLAARSIGDEATRLGCHRDAALLPLGALRHNHLGFFTIFDGDFAKYIQDFTDKTTFVFDSVFPHVDGAPPTPVAKNAQAFYQWALENNYPPIGFYSAYPGLGVHDIRALLADRESQSATACDGERPHGFADCVERDTDGDRRRRRSTSRTSRGSSSAPT